MRRLLKSMAGTLRKLGSAGAAYNAHFDIDRAARAGAELELRLRQVREPTSRRAA